VSEDQIITKVVFQNKAETKMRAPCCATDVLGKTGAQTHRHLAERIYMLLSAWCHTKRESVRRARPSAQLI
jgi:hypothetical protein